MGLGGLGGWVGDHEEIGRDKLNREMVPFPSLLPSRF